MFGLEYNYTYLHPEEVSLLSGTELEEIYSVSGLFNFFEFSISRENNEILMRFLGIFVEELETIHLCLHIFDEFDCSFASIGSNHFTIEVHDSCLKFYKCRSRALLKSLKHS